MFYESEQLSGSIYTFEIKCEKCRKVFSGTVEIPYKDFYCKSAREIRNSLKEDIEKVYNKHSKKCKGKLKKVKKIVPIKKLVELSEKDIAKIMKMKPVKKIVPTSNYQELISDIEFKNFKLGRWGNISYNDERETTEFIYPELAMRFAELKNVPITTTAGEEFLEMSEEIRANKKRKEKYIRSALR